jgi:hypothetical protein
MKYVYLLSLLFACLSNANAQCSLQNYKTDGGTVVREAKPEILYENRGVNNNGDLTQGYTRVHGRFSRYIKAGSTVVQWQLQTMMSGNRNAEFVPRRLDFHFTDGRVLTLEADTYDRQEGMKICTFKITGAAINTFKTPIQSVDVIDTRLNTMYTGTQDFGLYNRVLAEQLGCLE